MIDGNGMMDTGRERVTKLLGTAQITGAGASAVYTLPSAPAGMTAVVTDIFVNRGGGPYLGLCHVIFSADDIATDAASPTAVMSLLTIPATATSTTYSRLNVGIVETGGGIAGWCPTASDTMTVHVFGYEELATNVG